VKVLERQQGITEIERADLEHMWQCYQRWGLTPDPVRTAMILQGVTLVRPTPAHVHPGAVKATDGVTEWYLRPMTQPCVDDGCRVYLWDDGPEAFMVQHGDNQESVRRFPRRFFLSVAFPLSAERPDVFSWVIDCHHHEADHGEA
jgi:hypothetical protein